MTKGIFPGLKADTTKWALGGCSQQISQKSKKQGTRQNTEKKRITLVSVGTMKRSQGFEKPGLSLRTLCSAGLPDVVKSPPERSEHRVKNNLTC